MEAMVKEKMCPSSKVWLFQNPLYKLLGISNFHTVTAFLSESFDFVMVHAVALRPLFISSVTLIQNLSSLFILMGIFTGEAARVLPMSSPFARVYLVKWPIFSGAWWIHLCLHLFSYPCLILATKHTWRYNSVYLWYFNEKDK